MNVIRNVIAAGLFAIAELVTAAPDSISKILPPHEGTTITLAGRAAGWKDSWKPTAPNTFYLSDATGSIRVCIWPDDLEDVPPPVLKGLKTKNTPVRLSGEVAMFRERVEIHVTDGRAVSLVTSGAPGTAAPAAAPAVLYGGAQRQTAPVAPGAAVPSGYSR